MTCVKNPQTPAELNDVLVPILMDRLANCKKEHISFIEQKLTNILNPKIEQNATIILQYI